MRKKNFLDFFSHDFLENYDEKINDLIQKSAVIFGIFAYIFVGLIFLNWALRPISEEIVQLSHFCATIVTASPHVLFLVALAGTLWKVWKYILRSNP
jgi:hypothetical protein